MAIIFDGYQLAAAKEEELRQKVQLLLARGQQPQVTAIFFAEDPASQRYTELKRAAAERIGITYQAQSFSFATPVAEIRAAIQAASADPAVTGIIIQKPWTQRWLDFQQQSGKNYVAADFQVWWQSLVSEIAVSSSHGVNKDVDGLHPATLAAIAAGDWRQQGMVLPATVRAVLSILKFYYHKYETEGCYCREKVLIVGQSDLLGRPLYWQIKNEMEGRFIGTEQACIRPATLQLPSKQGEVKLVGKSGFNKLIEQENFLKDFSLIISATGQANLIQAEMLAEEVKLIDVGEPQADLATDCIKKAQFVTPVPGGVGPMTVVSLLANAIDLLKARD